jgi:RNA polymerase sigma-70 factor (ECF subfamily)
MANSALNFCSSSDRATEDPCGAARDTRAGRLFGADALCNLRRMALGMAGAGVDAEDLLQDTLERALASLDRFETGSNFYAWMRTIMYRLAVDRTRSRRRRKAKLEIERWAVPTSTAPVEEAPRPAPWSELDLGDVRDATAALSEPLRDTFVMFALDGLSYDEVAHRLGIPAQTVGTRVLRAKMKLRTVLMEQAGQRRQTATVLPLTPRALPAPSLQQLAA